jgi:hypothetical protein
MSKSNEPAFPVVGANTIYAKGMPLRTYLAGRAMMGLLANPALDLPKGVTIPEAAIIHADGLIEQLEKTEK